LVVIESTAAHPATITGALSLLSRLAPSLLSRFGPPLLLMAVIFFLSAQPDLNSGLGTWDTLLRKLAHMAEFGLLWWLWRRALGRGERATWAAAAIAVAYAATDEFHQSFVEGRVGSPVDVLIDAAGVALAIVAARVHDRRRAARRAAA
jgi:VanZ family protein